MLDEQNQSLRLEKVETTPQTPTEGVLQGFRKANAVLEAIDYFVHGTTLGLNALLTRTGARVAIITTQRFRDIYELGRTARDVMYDLEYRKPKSMVPRSLVFEVPPTPPVTLDPPLTAAGVSHRKGQVCVSP